MANIKRVAELLDANGPEQVELSINDIERKTGPLPQSYNSKDAYIRKGKRFYDVCATKGYTPVDVDFTRSHLPRPRVFRRTVYKSQGALR